MAQGGLKDQELSRGLDPTPIHRTPPFHPAPTRPLPAEPSSPGKKAELGLSWVMVLSLAPGWGTVLPSSL